MVENGRILYFCGLNKSLVLSAAQLYVMGFPHLAPENPTTGLAKMFYNHGGGLHIRVDTLYCLAPHPPVYAPPERCART